MIHKFPYFCREFNLSQMIKGVLFINSGAPKSTNPEDVKKFIREYLMDFRVMDYPYFIRKWKVDFSFLSKNLPQLTQAYENVWKEEFPPTVSNSIQFKDSLKQKLDLPIAVAMRYGKPSIQNALQELMDKGVKEVLVIPMFPQYTSSTVGTIVEQVKDIQLKLFKKMELTFLNSFYKHPDYINALSEHIKSQLPSEFDQLIFSYQGIPKRQDKLEQLRIKANKKANLVTYKDQCFLTSKLVSEQLGLNEENVNTSFLSPLSNETGIAPSTQLLLKEMGQQNIEKIVVVAPSNLVDTMESLEKVANEGSSLFIENGGKLFTYIKCLNDSEVWLEILCKWIEGWKSKEN